MSGAVLELSVENRIEDLVRINAGIDRFVRDAGLPDSPRRALFLVVEELFTNAVHHGYEDNRADGVDILVEHTGDSIRLVMRDGGKPFDVAETPTGPGEDVELQNIRIGGLGLYLVHELAASVTNRRVGDMNVTEVLLPIEAA